MKTNRSVTSVMASHSAATATFPPVTRLSTPRTEEIYYETLGALPASERGKPAVRMLAGTLAESIATVERCYATIAAEGDTVVTPQGGAAPHPLYSVASAAAQRVANLSMRLKLCPVADQRELARQASFEQQLRGGAPLVAPRPVSGEPVDWVKLAKQGGKNAAD